MKRYLPRNYSSWTNMKLHKALRQIDITSIYNSLSIGEKIQIVTDIWNSRHQGRYKVNAYVVEKYPYHCIVEFPWHNEKEALMLRRDVKYVDMLLSLKSKTLVYVDMREKGIDREVTI